MLFIVPVIRALFSAFVIAGTASAARVAIIAITTSNSMTVNAEEGFRFIFIRVLFFAAGWVPPSHKATADKCSEDFSEGFVLGFCFGLG